ncbi:MAG: thiolase family protein, partial [Candidatus Omnitrophota bacterium]|nr:thiolase family protein [Candidatus Omnitrophota bacterium]
MKKRKLPAVYIIDGVRTPISSPFRAFKDLSAVQLAAHVIKGLVKRHQCQSKIKEIILGNTVQAGIGQNPARQAALLAGLSPSVPAYTVNNVCGAGMQAVILAAQSLSLLDHQGMMIAGGSESATHAPFLINRRDEGSKHAEPTDSLMVDGLFCSVSQKWMGDLAEGLAQKYRISRQDQDAYALESHQKVVRAQARGLFSQEIIPVNVSKLKRVIQDDRPRENLRLEQLSDLPVSFKKGETVTAGNSSTPCDGAAAVLLASDSHY